MQKVIDFFSGRKISPPKGVLYSGFTSQEKGTGLSVFVFPEGLTTAALAFGGGPGSRETEATNAVNKKLSALSLAGGSAFGLDAASGISDYLYERGWGHKTAFARVPIVASAVVYDLYSNGVHWPRREEGYEACLHLSEAPIEEGDCASGTGCVCNKLAGRELFIKSGVGCAVCSDAGYSAFAYVVNNAYGTLVMTEVARVLREFGFDATPKVNTFKVVKRFRESLTAENTILGFVVLNAELDKHALHQIGFTAGMAFPRFTMPAFTEHDGDLLYVGTTGERSYKGELTLLAHLAEKALAEAILRSLIFSTPTPSAKSVFDFLNIK